MSDVEQSGDRKGEIVRELVDLVKTGRAPGWTELVLRAGSAGGVAGWNVWREASSGSDWVSSPQEIGPLVRELRSVMYETGRGTWFELEVKIPADGDTQTSFNYDSEPEPHWPLPNATYLDDQLAFPRDRANQPDWLREKLVADAAPADGAQLPASPYAKGTTPPSPQQAALIARGKQYLDMLSPSDNVEFELWPEADAVYVWQLGFGVGQVIVGADGSVLYGNTSLWRERMQELWRDGKRTPPEEFNEAAAERQRRAAE